MKLIQRSFALLALAALLVGYAGAAWSLSCHLLADEAPAHSEHGGKTGVPADCPLALVGTACTFSPSIPVAAVTPLAFAERNAVSASFQQPIPHLLRDVAIFHPPRA